MRRCGKGLPKHNPHPYTLMAGNFNSYGSTKSCTVYNFTYDRAVETAYNDHARVAGWPAHPHVTQ
jgi:hypothetical protein